MSQNLANASDVIYLCISKDIVQILITEINRKALSMYLPLHKELKNVNCTETKALNGILLVAECCRG